MRTGVIVFQSIMVIICFFFLGLVLAQRESKFIKLMLTIAFLALIMNTGCLMELGVTSVEAGLLATSVKYFGAVYLATCFFTFCKKYCRIPIKSHVHIGLIFWDTCLFGLMLTNDYHHMFFRNIYYNADAAIPSVVKEKAVLFYVYMASNLIQLLACVVVTAISARRTTSKAQKKNYIRLHWCVLTPLLLYGISFSPFLKGYDFLPASVTVAMLIMFYGLAVRKDFLLTDIAHDMILHNIQEPTIVLDSSFVIIEANEAAEKLLPLHYEDHRYAELAKKHMMLALEEESHMIEYNGKSYMMHGNKIHVDDSLVGYYFMWIDMTEQQERIRLMEQLRDEADKANKIKSEFLAGMSHEIRTPLNAIIGLNDVIGKETTQQEIKDYSMDIARSAKMLLTLVNDILDMAKIESNKMEIVPTDYVLRDVLDDLFNMHSVKAKEKGLRLDFIIDPFLPAVFKGDDIRIKQIITNLLSNAIKYTNHGSVTVKISGVRNQAVLRLRVEVKDTGLGIRKEDLAGIVEKFSRIYERASRYEEGTGLGLSIAVRLLKLMNSSLEISSEYGVGSVFAFEIMQPIVDGTDIFAYDSKKVKVETKEEDFTISGATILAVDDNEINLKLFRLLMKPFDCTLETCTGGKETLEATKKKKYDLIFLDHMMPDLDGVQTRDQMMEDAENQNHDTTIIMLTANAVNGAKEEYLELGFDDYLMKPIDIPALKQMLLAYLPDKVVKKD